jgi:lipopolysaccharide export system protein LptA
MSNRPFHSRGLMTSGLAAFFALLCVSPVFAQTLANTFGGLSESSSQPIDIESDQLTIYPQQYATFSGNVKAVQGTTTLRASELKVDYVGGGKDTVGATKQAESGEPAANKESGGEPAANKNGENSAGNKKGGEESAASKQTSKAGSPGQIQDPINIESDWLLINDKEKYAHFRGNVKIKQGTTKLGARELKVSYAGGDDLSANARMLGSGGAAQITKMEARGNVRALLKPAGLTKPKSPDVKSPDVKSPDAKLAETKAADTAPQNTTPGGDKSEAAHASNRPSGAEQSEPAVASNKAPGATAKNTTSPGDTARVEGAESKRDITKIEAKGGVVITSEKNETTSSDWAVFDLPLQLVTIGGNVLLTQNDNVLKGDRLVINMKTGESRFENSGDRSAGGRIRALFMPKGSKSEDGGKHDAAAEKPQRKAAPGQPTQGTRVESREPPPVVPEYR